MNGSIQNRVKALESNRRKKINWWIDVTYQDGRKEHRPYSFEFLDWVMTNGTEGTGVISIEDDSGIFNALRNDDGTFHPTWKNVKSIKELTEE